MGTKANESQDHTPATSEKDTAAQRGSEAGETKPESLDDLIDVEFLIEGIEDKIAPLA